MRPLCKIADRLAVVGAVAAIYLLVTEGGIYLDADIAGNVPIFRNVYNEVIKRTKPSV